MSGPRDVLLGKAIAHYAEHGVRDTSLRALAAAIGTSQRMLHYHFGSREDLLAAVVERVAESHTETLERLAAQADDPFDALVHHWQLVRDAAGRFGPLHVELCAHAMYGRAYAARLTDTLVTRYVAAFAAVYATVTDGPHARRLARLSLGVGRGVLFDMLLDGDVAAADAAVEEFTAMVRARLGAADPRHGNRP